MLESLSMCRGVSGNEDEARRLILNTVRPLCDNVTIDTMGNVIAFKKGTNSTKKLMAAAHMDEVGFIIKSITDEGFLKFGAVGSIDPRILLGTRVLVGNNAHRGVIGIKAVHMQTPQEREIAPPITELYMDIGAVDKQEAEKMVSLGDYATYNSKFLKTGENRVKGKALDDRAGCAVLIELLKEAYENDLYACFTAQEEIGIRGATVAAYNIMPDAALILETTVCADIFETEERVQSTQSGQGAAVSIIDSTSYSDRRLVEKIIELAKQHNIPCQYRRSHVGGNDSGAIQTAGTGVRTAIISIPCRYIHSPSCVLDLGDFNAVLRLSQQFLSKAGDILNDTAFK